MTDVRFLEVDIPDDWWEKYADNVYDLSNHLKTYGLYEMDKHILIYAKLWDNEKTGRPVYAGINDDGLIEIVTKTPKEQKIYQTQPDNTERMESKDPEYYLIDEEDVIKLQGQLIPYHL